MYGIRQTLKVACLNVRLGAYEATIATLQPKLAAAQTAAQTAQTAAAAAQKTADAALALASNAIPNGAGVTIASSFSALKKCLWQQQANFVRCSQPIAAMENDMVGRDASPVTSIVRHAAATVAMVDLGHSNIHRPGLRNQQKRAYVPPRGKCLASPFARRVTPVLSRIFAGECRCSLWCYRYISHGRT